MVSEKVAKSEARKPKNNVWLKVVLGVLTAAAVGLVVAIVVILVNGNNDDEVVDEEEVVYVDPEEEGGECDGGENGEGCGCGAKFDDEIMNKGSECVAAGSDDITNTIRCIGENSDGEVNEDTDAVLEIYAAAISIEEENGNDWNVVDLINARASYLMNLEQCNDAFNVTKDSELGGLPRQNQNVIYSTMVGIAINCGDDVEQKYWEDLILNNQDEGQDE